MLSAKAYIRKIALSEHGGCRYEELRRLGLEEDKIIDFSVCVNPFKLPAGLKQAIAAADLQSYPDTDSHLLKNELADRLGVTPQNLLIGNGSTELIRLAATAYIGRGDRVMIPQPTYGEYETAAAICGAEVIRFPLAEKKDFQLSPDELQFALEKTRPRALFLCNPNNPTGQYLPSESVERLLVRNPHCLLVLDEAYTGFLENPWSSVDLIKHPNLLILRSMTKDYGLAGIRLGYAVAGGALIKTLSRVKPPWNVSAVAQCAGVWVLQNYRDMTKMRSDLDRSGRYLKAELVKMGLRLCPLRRISL
jgi:histidinol-phosphate aminotransferase